MTAAAMLERPENQAESRSRRDATIHVRVPQQTRDLITTAAATVGKTVTDFVLDSARQHAIDVLLDQRLFDLDADQHEAFMRVLNDPPQPNARLKKLLSEKAPWEK
jgi:uncharacterized protein (DUF1778 family)